jgi:hypothetical protein
MTCCTTPARSSRLVLGIWCFSLLTRSNRRVEAPQRLSVPLPENGRKSTEQAVRKGTLTSISTDPYFYSKPDMATAALIEALRAAAAAGDPEAPIFLPRFADWFVRSANAGQGDGQRAIPAT